MIELSAGQLVTFSHDAPVYVNWYGHIEPGWDPPAHKMGKRGEMCLILSVRYGPPHAMVLHDGLIGYVLSSMLEGFK